MNENQIEEWKIKWWNTILFIFIIILFIRIIQKRPKKIIQKKIKRKEPIRTLIVLGSGGHTMEMFQFLSTLNLEKFNPRLYVIASTDITSKGNSKEKTEEFENNKFNNNNMKDMYHYIIIPRSREVGQSWFTSFFTFLYAYFVSLKIIFIFKPELVRIFFLYNIV